MTPALTRCERGPPGRRRERGRWCVPFCMMTPHHLELASSDRNALCAIFLDGRLAALGRGSATAAVRDGQQIRWFVRSRRRTATFALTERRGVREVQVAAGRCEPPLLTGHHLAARPVARRRAARAHVRGERALAAAVGHRPVAAHLEAR